MGGGGGLREGLVSSGLLQCLFVGVMASWAFCWWGSSIVLYGVFGSPWFRERGVCGLCLLCWYFDFPSIFFLDFFL